MQDNMILCLMAYYHKNNKTIYFSVCKYAKLSSPGAGASNPNIPMNPVCHLKK